MSITFPARGSAVVTIPCAAASLRKTLIDTEQETRRRLTAWPDGIVRTKLFADGTSSENCLTKICCELALLYSG